MTTGNQDVDLTFNVTNYDLPLNSPLFEFLRDWAGQ